MKKTLVFHNGRAPDGMHEYLLLDQELLRVGVTQGRRIRLCCVGFKKQVGWDHRMVTLRMVCLMVMRLMPKEMTLVRPTNHDAKRYGSSSHERLCGWYHLYKNPGNEQVLELFKELIDADGLVDCFCSCLSSFVQLISLLLILRKCVDTSGSICQRFAWSIVYHDNF
ncbi:NAC domain-containing protein [Artemisia annua]|uniref:NAC domain-containing protein n=1 Tax=Artemisia annua TaxID=35608 RepID=A0A2U1NF09_ARTAN|nr:NAC domain-containing protein [Artemisia annua]